VAAALAGGLTVAAVAYVALLAAAANAATGGGQPVPRATLAPGCQRVLWTAGDVNRRGVVCYALKQPPAGMRWNLVLDGQSTFTIHRGSVVEGFLFTPGQRQVRLAAEAAGQRRCTRDIGVRRGVGNAIASWTHKCIAYVSVIAEWNDGVPRYGPKSAGLASVVYQPTWINPLAKPNCAGWAGYNSSKQLVITKFPVVGTC